MAAVVRAATIWRGGWVYCSPTLTILAAADTKITQRLQKALRATSQNITTKEREEERKGGREEVYGPLWAHIQFKTHMQGWEPRLFFIFWEEA